MMRNQLNRTVKNTLMFFSIVIGTVVLGNDTNQTKMTFINQTATPVLTQHYSDANTSNTNIKTYNTKDWEGEMSKNNLQSTSLIGNVMSIFGDTPDAKVFNSTDMNQLKTSELQKNKLLSNNKSIGALDSVLQNIVINDVASNVFADTVTKAKDIKCYITRDIGTTYMCTAPNNSLMMSSGMGGKDSMSKLKSECEGQCYSQTSCIDMQANVQTAITPFQAQSAALTKNSPTYSFTIPVDSSVTLNTLDFNETRKDATIKYTVTYVDKNGKTNTLVQDLFSTVGSIHMHTLYVGDITSSITITMALSAPFPDAINATVTLDNIQLNYNSNSQYICPPIQDISNINSGNFGNTCKEGRLTVLTRNGSTLNSKSYTICANSIYPGQNQDGSFYQQHACESICRKQYECKLLPGGQVNFEGLKGFREGCIENTGISCDNFNEDCMAARLNPEAKVVNEIVFGGDNRPVSTIIKGISTGVERPRLSLSTLSPTLGPDGGTYAPNDVQFENEKKEEWKDIGYSDMMKNANWNVTLPRIGENTAANHAYGINLKSGSFYGYAGTSIRALMWRLKPAAFDVGTGNSFGLYAVIRAIIQNYRSDQTGDTATMKPYYDEVWYVKTSAGDTFKPFFYNYDAYQAENSEVDFNLSIPSFVLKPTASPQFTTFDGTAWSAISPSSSAESFQSDGFTATNAFWEYEILGNMEGKYDVLPGIIRSIIKPNAYTTTPVYTGPRNPFDAGSIVKISVNVGYSTTPLSYQNLKDMVDNGTLTTIYETGAENMYPRYFRGDGEKDNNVVIYIYGQQAKGSAYLNVRPKAEHVGKKGFIYVYGE